MTAEEHAERFYRDYLAGNMEDEWDADDAKELIADLALAFREAMGDAADALDLHEQSEDVMTLGGKRR